MFYHIKELSTESYLRIFNQDNVFLLKAYSTFMDFLGSIVMLSFWEHLGGLVVRILDFDSRGPDPPLVRIPWATAVEVLSPNRWTSREFPPFGLLMLVPPYWRIFFESTTTVDSSGEDLWTCTESGHTVHVG